MQTGLDWEHTRKCGHALYTHVYTHIYQQKQQHAGFIFWELHGVCPRKRKKKTIHVGSKLINKEAEIKWLYTSSPTKTTKMQGNKE